MITLTNILVDQMNRIIDQLGEENARLRNLVTDLTREVRCTIEAKATPM